MTVTKMDIKPGDGVIMNGFLILAAPGDYIIMSAERGGQMDVHDAHAGGLSFKSTTIYIEPPEKED